MGQIKLTKLEREDTYNATCDILLNGAYVGRWDVTYGYTEQGRLRVNGYWVLMNETDTALEFQVDGRWETKGSRGGKFCAEYDTFRDGYKTAKAAKAAALAFIKSTVVDMIISTVEAAEAAEVAEVLEAADPTKLCNDNPQSTLLNGQTGRIIFGICLDGDYHWFNITGSDADAAHQIFNLYRDRITNSSDEDAYWALYFDDGVDAVQGIWLEDCNSVDRDRIESIMSTSRPVQATETVQVADSNQPLAPSDPKHTKPVMFEGVRIGKVVRHRSYHVNPFGYVWYGYLEIYGKIGTSCNNLSEQSAVDMVHNMYITATAQRSITVDMPTRPLFSSFLSDMRQTAKAAAAASPLTFTIRYVEDNIDAITDEWSALIQADIKQAEQMIADGHQYSGYIQQQLDTLQAMMQSLLPVLVDSVDRDRILSIMSTSRPVKAVEAVETVETPAEPVEAYVVDMPTRPSFSSFLSDMRQTAKAAAAASPLTFTIRYVEDNIDAITDEWSAVIAGDIKQAEQMIADGHQYSGYIQQQLDTLQAMLPECSFDATDPESFNQ